MDKKLVPIFCHNSYTTPFLAAENEIIRVNRRSRKGYFVTNGYCLNHLLEDLLGFVGCPGVLGALGAGGCTAPPPPGGVVPPPPGDVGVVAPGIPAPGTTAPAGTKIE